MSSNDEVQRGETLKLLHAYQTLLSQRRLEEWIELWSDDGVLEFPFAPAGRRRDYRGKAEILAYMKLATGKISMDTIEQMRVSPMQDPAMVVVELSFKGCILMNDAPYRQSLIIFFEVRDGKLCCHREYWNPLATIDALGGREKWASSFGFPAE